MANQSSSTPPVFGRAVSGFGCGIFKEEANNKHWVALGDQKNPWLCAPEQAREIALALLQAADEVAKANGIAPE